MKKPHLLILCSFILISCSNINQKVFQSGINDICSDPTNSSEKKVSVISVPIIQESYLPPKQIKDGFKEIESNNNIYNLEVGTLKGNMFITKYNINNKVIAKIFDQNGNEIVNRFEIANLNELGYFKIITDKKLDYFFVFYQIKDIGTNANSGIY